jgi:CubicO group peptidase (beta-lactamase class C family)
MVARKGKIVYSDAIGFQDNGANTPMKARLDFRIYSMTKPLVSVAAMMLVEDGVIQLTDPISKFLPAFKDMQVSVATPGPDGKATSSQASTETEVVGSAAFSPQFSKRTV